MNKICKSNAEKPSYEAPALTDHGPVSELTEASTFFGGVDGGAFPNIYSS